MAPEQTIEEWLSENELLVKCFANLDDDESWQELQDQLDAIKESRKCRSL